MDKKEKIIDIIIEAMYNDIAPNVVADDILLLFGVSQSLPTNKDKFIELAKMIEIHIQKSDDYKMCIGTGHFTERFNKVYEDCIKRQITD